MSNSIPFVDLYAQYQTIKSDIDNAIADVIEKSAFVRGPYVETFEQTFAEAMEREYCVSCANGTDALYIALVSLGISPGDEVLAPAHSWISTTETISQAGGRVVFCDTERDTFTIDPNSIKEKITSRTVGIVPVHLFGQAADMDAIMKIAQENNLWVLEDCAQSHIARYRGQLVGTFGDAATYSFYPGKNLGAMGDAGAIVTNHERLANKMTMFARHGGLKKGDHQIEGINSRLDGMQAAILSVKLPHLTSWTEARRRCAERYSNGLRAIKQVSVPQVAEGNEHVFHLYVVKCKDRDGLAEHLASNGVQTVINYPVALPYLPAYARYNHRPSDFPNAFRNQSEILSLPIYPELTDEQVDTVIELIAEYFNGCQQ